MQLPSYPVTPMLDIRHTSELGDRNVPHGRLPNHALVTLSLTLLTCHQYEGVPVDECNNLLQAPHEALHNAHKPLSNLVLLLQLPGFLVKVLQHQPDELDDGNDESPQSNAA